MENKTCVIWLKDKTGQVYFSECDNYACAAKEAKAARANGFKLVDIWHAPIK